MGIQLDHTQEHISVTKKVSKSHKKRGKYWIDLGLVLKKNLVIGKHRLVFVA